MAYQEARKPPEDTVAEERAENGKMRSEPQEKMPVASPKVDEGLKTLYG